MTEIVDIICESKQYRRRLVFTNNRASKNLEICTKVVALVKSRMQDRQEEFNFTLEHTRIQGIHATLPWQWSHHLK